MSRRRQVRRRRLFVDSKVQGALLLRVFFYWVVCLITITLMLLCWSILRTPRMFYTHFDDMWFHYGPALIASFILLPMVLVDIIRLSNRFAGPLMRLRREMRALARGEEVRAIHFRESDFWQEFADEFNVIAAKMGQLVPAEEPTDQQGQAEEASEELEAVGAAD